MRIPQPPERVKEAPAQALRAVFAGVGQVLLLTERVRQRTIAQVHTGRVSASAPVCGSEGTVAGEGIRPASGPADPAQAKAGTTKAAAAKADIASARASTAKTTTGQAEAGTAKAGPAAAGMAVHKQRTLDAKGHVRMVETAPAEASAPEAAVPEATAVAEAAAPEVTPKATVSEVAAAGLPVPSYSELSVPSLRARLRGLDAGQVRALLEYERTHAGRDNVITMFERRIAKLEGPDNADSAAG